MKQTAIIIGASSGIGRALAKVLHQNGYRVIATARRLERLQELAAEQGEGLLVKKMDIADTSASLAILKEIVSGLQPVELIVLNAAVGGESSGMAWETQKEIIDINVRGTTALLNWAYSYFKKKGSGHIVTVSSVTAVRGNRYSPAYAASKAFITHFMQGLRQRARKEKAQVTLTDILPGFVDTAMIAGRKQAFWIASPGKAARQIYGAIKKKKSFVYVSKRWRLAAWLIKALPEGLYNRL